MKGIALSAPDGKVVKAVRSTVIISNKEGVLRLLLIGNAEGNPDISHTWYSRDLRPGDRFWIRHCDMEEAELSVPEYTVDYGNPDAIDALILEDYRKLRKELIEEGLINENE